MTNKKKKTKEVLCPNCGQPIWDYAFASKLNKCWNCMFAFDSPEEETDAETES